VIGCLFDPDTDTEPDADKAGMLLFTTPSKAGMWSFFIGLKYEYVLKKFYISER
jgi:hypothetical protein